MKNHLLAYKKIYHLFININLSLTLVISIFSSSLFLSETFLSVSYAASIKEFDSYWVIELDRIALHLDNKNAQIIRILDKFTNDNLSKGKGGLYLIDNKSKKELFSQSASFKTIDKNTLEITIDFGDPTLDVKCILTSNGTVVLLKVSIRNLATEQRQLEVRYSFPMKYEAEWQYWDGFDGFGERGTHIINDSSNVYAINADPVLWKIKGGEKPKSPVLNLIRGNAFIFPINSIFNKKYGIAIGLDPNFVQSYYSGGVQPNSSSYESFYYSLKFVVDSGANVTQGFVFYDFDPGYQYRSALDIYYRAFPLIFSKRKSVDPRYGS